MLVITISRQTGSMGEEIALELARVFGLPLIDREYVQDRWLSSIAKSAQLNVLKDSPRAHLSNSSEGTPFYISIENRLKAVALESGAVILGLGAQIIFQDSPYAFHVRIISPEQVRISRICAQYGIEPIHAQKLIKLSDRKRKKYLMDVYSQNWEDNHLYHIILNTEKLSFEDAAKVVAGMFPDKIKASSSFFEHYSVDGKTKKRRFVHQSEVDFVNILEMYHIEWKYEPTTFPIEWDAEGNVIKAFTPDFFLPEYQAYIELTTMNQKYVTEKNKKLRRLKALYPDVNITILYKKDIMKLLKKFGVVKEV